MLPEEILLAIMRHLDPSSLCRMESVSHRFYAICTEYSQSLWRQRCTITWGIPSTTSDPALPGYFIPRDVDWKTMFEERHNLYTGQNRFRMIADINDLDQRAKRQELVDERRHCYARRPRKYILHCGQPTTAGSGYAVNLRLCGPYMIWISNTNVAVCKVDGHTPHILEGHTASVIALTTNQRNLVVTAAEDATMRIWDLTTLSCIRVMRGVDVLDCATHENILVSYNNDNVIDVWDVETHTRLRKIDVRKFAGVEPSVLTREVKIAVWGDHIVCGFENTVFLIISRLDGTLTHTLSEPRHYHREEFDSTSYPTVLAMYDNILVTRGIRCHEMCVWDLKAGTLLYRLSESISFQATIGHPIRPSEVITDFTLDARGSFLMCTVENEGGDVYLLSWDFRKAWFEDDGWASGAGNAGLATWGNGYTGAWGMGNLGPGGAGGGESEIVAGLWRKRMGVKERRYEKRSLEGVAGEVRFEYTNFWLCYET
ncbi:uncharacterized protein EV422DRAFT_531843 [Fimicolochytrium jonesii]|uniref:uncharacterized protein n=1 Tax=Fimicolochytrium jonesii TaxID=1396493 RepID=UPI0022FF4055|nr:uncharacterized protein EV422DRAFT_531843 [Fimicolochytrium jonesii]KAI8820150.1 hypothetical protein EV422DRAFT_531843 [Fimicolochytrium jonesii]